MKKKNNSNNCDDRIIDEQSITANIQPSEDARRASSRPLRKLGVISKFVIGLCISLVLLLFPLLAKNKDGLSDNEVTANALTIEEISPVSYYLVFPANTVFVSVGNWTNSSYYILNFTIAGDTVSFIVYLTDNPILGVDNFVLYRSNSISPPEYSLSYDFYYPITPSDGELFIDYSGMLGVDISITNFSGNSVLVSKTSVFPLIVKYNALTDSEITTMANSVYDIGYSQGIQDASNEYYEIGYEEGYQGGYDRGYSVGINSIDFDGNFVDWIVTSVGAFFSFEILPNFSLGGLLGIIVMVVVAIWLLKLFAGG